MKEVKAEFKITSLGKIPGEWELVYLKDILSLIRNGLVTEQNKDGRGIPITRIETISEEKINPERVGYIENVSEKEISEYRLQRGDILFSHINSLDHIGKTALYFGDPPLLLHGMNLLLLRSQNSIVEPFYLYYQLKYLKAKDLFRNVSKKAVNQASINQTELGKIELALPPLPEQKTIAEILSTVDQAIEKVNEAIKKTQRLKNGLMQELLTKGIGHKEFKDTEVGRISKEWKIARLGEIGELERGKFAFRPRNDPRFYGGNFPFIQTGDIREANGIIRKYSQTLNEDGFKISKLFKKGTIVISIAGNIGDVGILDFDSCFPDSIVGIKANSEKTNQLFLMYLLQKFKSGLDSIAPRSTQKNINLGILETFKLPLPSLPEQQKIAEILNTVDERLELLRKRKERLKRTKKGLMNDLLTGRKRVTSLI